MEKPLLSTIKSVTMKMMTMKPLLIEKAMTILSQKPTSTMQIARPTLRSQHHLPTSMHADVEVDVAELSEVLEGGLEVVEEEVRNASQVVVKMISVVLVDSIPKGGEAAESVRVLTSRLKMEMLPHITLRSLLYKANILLVWITKRMEESGKLPNNMQESKNSNNNPHLIIGATVPVKLVVVVVAEREAVLIADEAEAELLKKISILFQISLSLSIYYDKH